MWRNRDVVQFVEWMRARNDAHAHPATKVRFYGLDLYSLQASIEAVIGYLDRVDPAEARRARDRYSCFDHVGAEGQAYGYALAYENAIPCENEVVAQLVSLRSRAEAYLRRDGWVAEGRAVLRGAERARRARRRGVLPADVPGRGLVVEPARPAHGRHARRARRAPRSPARADEGRRLGAQLACRRRAGHRMGARGELNVGQLARQRYGNECLLVGFSTYDGRVTAASDWGGIAERKHVRPALPGSHEALLHDVGLRAFWLATADHTVHDILNVPRLERAIGVIYRPETERQSHYFDARLADQFDAVIHFDRTRALEPLERTSIWDRGEPPETFPSGI